MPMLHLRCHNCGSRVEINVGELEESHLRAEGYLNRYCNQCRGNSRWDLHETAAATRLTPPDPAAKTRGRILVIDDDPNILLLLQRALGREPFDVEFAESARDAIGRLVHGDYDLILSDIRMPDFDGKQLFEFLDKHMPEYRHRVIFLTGDTGNPDTIEFLESARRPYLAKPLDVPALLEALRRFVRPS